MANMVYRTNIAFIAHIGNIHYIPIIAQIANKDCIARKAHIHFITYINSHIADIGHVCLTFL